VFGSQKNHSFFAIHQATSPNQIRWTRLLLKAGGVLERTRPSHKIQGSQIPTIEYREGGDPLDYPTKEKHDMVKSPLRMSLWRSEQSTILSRIAGAIQTRQEILVNGQIVNVTTNLEEALRRLRVRDPGSFI
jgi:hypothetical protein